MIRYLIWIISQVEKVVGTKAFQAYGTRLHDIPFPGCENYVFDSDEYWQCAIMQTSITLDHQVSTRTSGQNFIIMYLNRQLLLCTISKTNCDRRLHPRPITTTQTNFGDSQLNKSFSINWPSKAKKILVALVVPEIDVFKLFSSPTIYNISTQ